MNSGPFVWRRIKGQPHLPTSECSRPHSVIAPIVYSAPAEIAQ
jgi:hypothetical protein